MELSGWVSMDRTKKPTIMNISWIVSSTYVFPNDIDINKVKAIGPIWGSWRSWKYCHTDNVVCDDFGQAQVLCKRAMQAVCNLYLPRRLYQDLMRPQGVRWYDGEFSQEVNSIEDIISMHLAAPQNDIILLVGFDLATPSASGDTMSDHRLRNQLGLTRQIIADNLQTQWVVIDHVQKFDPAFGSMKNIMPDSMTNIFKLLNQ
jgi:hypothetical protein